MQQRLNELLLFNSLFKKKHENTPLVVLSFLTMENTQKRFAQVYNRLTSGIVS